MHAARRRVVSWQRVASSGIKWHWVAAVGWLAVAALAQRVAPPGAVDVGEQFGLPPLPTSRVVLHTRLRDPRSQETLRAVSSAFLNAAY